MIFKACQPVPRLMGGTLLNAPLPVPGYSHRVSPMRPATSFFPSPSRSRGGPAIAVRLSQPVEICFHCSHPRVPLPG